VIDETKGQWYLRQMLGSANFDAGPALRFISGNLCHQIEHHLYPDLPSNRLHAISVRVREVCDNYDLPYTTGSFPVQYAKAWRTIAKLSLPDRYLCDSADDALESRSESSTTNEAHCWPKQFAHAPTSQASEADLTTPVCHASPGVFC
jgi:fatty acid desaturase